MMKRIKKGSVSRNIARQIQAKKDEQREGFATRRYDSLRALTFVDADSVNMGGFRAMSKDLLSSELPCSAAAVYPVMCSRADFEKDDSFQISQQNIGFLAGVSDDTARKGIRELESARLLTSEKVTDRTRHYYVYKVDFIRKPTLQMSTRKCGGAVYFYTCIIDNGIWAAISLGAKALYLVLRAESYQDLDLYNDIENVTSEWYHCYGPMEFDEYIKSRKWDTCTLSLTEMRRKVSIGRANVSAALDELERYGLVERIGEWTKVYLKPKRLIRYSEQ